VKIMLFLALWSVWLGIGTSLLLAGAGGAGDSRAETLLWAGYDWQVRSGTGGPGPNTWDPANVWVDALGQLHLRIAQTARGWTCAELYTTARLGFGIYQFWVTGRLDQLDPRVVLGLFHYPTEDVGPDGTNEIDIEFARWDNPAWPNGNYTVWPKTAGPPQLTWSFELVQTGTHTTQRYHWRPGRVCFQSLHGHRHDTAGLAAAWPTPDSHLDLVAAQPMPVHLNLWLFQGQPPLDGQEVEIVLVDFRYFAYDLDQDGSVSAADPRLLAGFLAGNAVVMPGGAAGTDANHDGKAGATDLVLEQWGAGPLPEVTRTGRPERR